VVNYNSRCQHTDDCTGALVVGHSDDVPPYLATNYAPCDDNEVVIVDKKNYLVIVGFWVHHRPNGHLVDPYYHLVQEGGNFLVLVVELV
jgi:hypothetical protein